jgi:hypothetical protein
MTGAVTGGTLGGAGAMRPRDTDRFRAGSSAFAPAAHGGLPPVRYPGHHPPPAGRRNARRPAPRREGPSSRHSSLEPGEITVISPGSVGACRKDG